MASLRLAARGPLLAALVGIGIAISPRSALAVGEEITDVRILDNQRTEESTVRSVAGCSIGDTLEADTLDMVREHPVLERLPLGINERQHGPEAGLGLGTGSQRGDLDTAERDATRPG